MYNVLKNMNKKCELFLDECFFENRLYREKAVEILEKFKIIDENYEEVIGFDSAIEMDYIIFKNIYIKLLTNEYILNLIENSLERVIDISSVKNKISIEKSEYLAYKKSIEVDKIIDNLKNIEQFNRNKKLNDMKEVKITKKTILLDNNVISFLENNEEFFYEFLKLNDKFQIIYSPINIEEIVKRGNHEDSVILEKISKLTENIGIFRTNDNKIKLFKEHPKYSYKRIKAVGRDVNYSIERYRELVSLDNSIEDYEYNSQKHRDYINSNDNILENIECRTMLNEAVRKYGGKSLEEYKNVLPEFFENYTNTNSAIYALMNGLMFVGYQCDKKKKKKNTIRSGVYDVEQLIFAIKTNFFFTKDKRFAKRASVIFKILNVKTKVLYFKSEEDLKELIQNLIKEE